MREANRFQSEIALSNDEIPEATKGSLTHTHLCARRDDENPWMNFIIDSSEHTPILCRVRTISTRLQLFTIHSHTQYCASTVEWSEFILFFWKLKPVSDRFGRLLFCHYCHSPLLYYFRFGATECDTVQHFHWLSFECRDCFTHCSISIFNCFFSFLFLLPLVVFLLHFCSQLGDTPMLEYNWIWLYLFCWSVRFSRLAGRLMDRQGNYELL